MPSEVYPVQVQIREVGPRDGLQGEEPLPPWRRAAFVNSLFGAGFTSIEAVSFVSPKAVPAMAGAAEVLAALDIPQGVRIAALVANVRGADMALECGVDELTVTVSASPEYSMRNVRMTVEQSLEQVKEICAQTTPVAVPVDAIVSCAFGSPYEGDIAPAEVKDLCDKLIDCGASAITLADTTGMGTPRRISEILTFTGTDVGLHLHDTRGTALVNLFAAMLAGVTRFDTALGGLGGSPFAKGAGGNVATEDVVAMLDDLGVRTGIDLRELMAVYAVLEGMVGHQLPGHVGRAGPRT